MSKTISNLSVGLFGDVSSFAQSFGRTAPAAVNSFVGSIGSAGATLLKFTGVAGLVSAAIGGIFSLKEGFSLAADFEQTTVAMGVMLGSADKAKEVLGELKQFSNSTPFRFPELAASAKQLSAFGIDADELLPTLKMLGDIASGTGKPIGELADLYGKVRVQGKLSGEEIRQFTTAGIPLVALLAKQFNTTTAGVHGMVEAGQIGFPAVQKAFLQLTASGGRFAGLTEKQGTTLKGLWSTLQDSIGNTLQRIAEELITSFDLKTVLVNVTTAADRIGNVLVNVIHVAAPVIKTLGTLFTQTLAPAADFLATHINQVRAALIGAGAVVAVLAIPALVTGITTAATAVAGLAAALASPIAIAVALGAATAVVLDHFGALDPILSFTARLAYSAFDAIAGVAVPVMEAIANAATEAWKTIGNMAAGIGEIAKQLGAVLGIDLDKWMAEHEAKGKARAQAITDWFKNLIGANDAAAKKLDIKPPKIEPLAPMELSVTPKIDRAPLLKFGSAASHLLQYEFSRGLADKKYGSAASETKAGKAEAQAKTGSATPPAPGAGAQPPSPPQPATPAASTPAPGAPTAPTPATPAMTVTATGTVPPSPALPPPPTPKPSSAPNPGRKPGVDLAAIQENKKYAGTAMAGEGWVDSHGQRHHYDASHPDPYGPTNGGIGFGGVTPDQVQAWRDDRAANPSPLSQSAPLGSGTVSFGQVRPTAIDQTPKPQPAPTASGDDSRPGQSGEAVKSILSKGYELDQRSSQYLYYIWQNTNNTTQVATF